MDLVIPRFVCKVIRHKYHVFRFGLRTGAPLWRLVIHDWSKLLPPEIGPYARRFCGTGGNDLEFAHAWNHQSKTHPHHHEWWIPVSTHCKSPVPAGKPLPMAEWAVREMVADWLGAEASYNDREPTSLAGWEWYQEDRPKMILHPDTAVILDRVLADYFAKYARA